MATRRDIDAILKNWDFDPNDVRARLIKARDGRQVLQMRVEMGILQMEVTGRPDGSHPEGADTYFDYLKDRALLEPEGFELTEDECAEADREFVQFYHRRICWLRLGEYDRAVRDADHSLAFMDFVKDHSPSDEWTLSHEQYRPFILFHRTQASALAVLDREGDSESGPEKAIETINEGLRKLKEVFVEYEVEEQFSDDEMVKRLEQLKSGLREHFKVGRTLVEQLADAVAAEEYELAAKLRDEIAKRRRM